MRMLTTLLVFAVLAGCPAPDDTGDIEGPCPVTTTPFVEFAQRDALYGQQVDGDALAYGHPPQGGAPFAPFLVRAHGLGHSADGYRVTLDAVDTQTDEVLGQGEYPQLFVCANVGDNAGYRVAPELHMRFYGWELDDLEGRQATVTVTLDDGSGVVLQDGYTAILGHDLQ